MKSSNNVGITSFSTVDTVCTVIAKWFMDRVDMSSYGFNGDNYDEVFDDLVMDLNEQFIEIEDDACISLMLCNHGMFVDVDEHLITFYQYVY
jgi:hypothetical protein